MGGELTYDQVKRGRDLVDGDRETDYGHPVESHKQYALAWSAILRVEVSPKQVALCMAALKLVREGHRHKADNLDDAHGYVDIARRIAKSEELNT